MPFLLANINNSVNWLKGESEQSNVATSGRNVVEEMSGLGQADEE